MKKITLSIILAGIFLSMPAVCGEQQPIPFSKLVEYLPDPPNGWERGEAGGGTLSTSSGSWSSADITYTKGDNYVNLIIFDSGSAEIPYWDIWDSYSEFDSGEEYMKAVDVEGYPAWEAFDKKTKEYSIFIGIDKRFGIIVSTDDTIETLYQFVDSIDLMGISGLKNFEGAEKSEETGDSIPGFGVALVLIGVISALYLMRFYRN